MDLYGRETLTTEVELPLYLETGRVPLQNRPITAAGVRLLTGRDSFKILVKHTCFHTAAARPLKLIITRLLLMFEPITLTALVSLPAMLISAVHCESSHFTSVFSQLFVAGHAVSVNDVYYRVLRANPHLLLDQSQHAVLHR